MGLRLKESKEALFAKFFVAAEDFGEAIGIEQQLVAFLDTEGFGLVGAAGQHTERGTAGAEQARFTGGTVEEGRIVTRVDDFELMGGGLETAENGGDIAAAGFDAFLPVQGVHAFGDFGEGEAGAAHGTEAGAEGHADHGGGEPFAGDVGQDHHEAAVGQGDDVDVVAANFVASGGADIERIAGNVRDGLREEAALDGTGGVEVSAEAFPFDHAFVMLGVADGEGGLMGQTFKEVGFFEAQGPGAVGDEVGDGFAAFAVEGGRRR